MPGESVFQTRTVGTKEKKRAKQRTRTNELNSNGFQYDSKTGINDRQKGESNYIELRRDVR